MLGLIIVSSILVLGVGLLVKFILDKARAPDRITWLEFAIGATLIVFFIAPVTGYVGWKIAKSNVISYNEYWNGWETEAVDDHVTCRINGSCHYTYDCNCHLVTTCTMRDDKGNCTQTETHEECDSCPYFTYERRLSINTTLGEYYVGRLAPADYENQLKRGRLPRGFGPKDYTPPQYWTECKQRIDSGHPGPVTKRMKYDNYIYASDQTILKEYSDRIDEFKNQDLLPDVVSDIHDMYHADKVSFVGFNPSDSSVWQEALSYLNAGLGTELQGDLHLVITQDESITQNRDGYITALKAYWIDPHQWGKNTISKNSIIVVVGTSDGATIDWARATTGMPLGNERMLLEIQNVLPGLALTPESLIGRTQGSFYREVDEDGKTHLRVASKHANGALEQILWGIDEPSARFVRISMTARDENDVGGGFLYLGSQIEPTTGQKVLIGFFITLLSSPVWIIFGLTEIQTKKTYVERYRTRSSQFRDW